MMKRIVWVWVVVLVAASLAGCGGSGSGGEDLVTISGRLTSSPVAARAAAAGGSYYVEAVDESGTTQDIVLGVTEMFQLQVPVDHDYVLVVGDDDGPIGGMRYGAPGQERSEFRVRDSVDLGDLVVDRENRSVRGPDDSEIEEPDHADRPDNDGDGIPDYADDDDDNDGIHDGSDDMSKDHDNDGLDDDDDMDDDNDGIVDDSDNHPMDIDDDGEDDDRDQCDRRSDRGAELWIDSNCGSCHGVDGSGGEESIRDVNVNEIVHALKKGEGEPGDDEYMPAYPELVRFGTDFRAFLGCNGDDDGVCLAADAANGKDVFETNCVGCHSAAEVGDEDAEEIAEVLAEGEDNMPAMSGFVNDAADIAAYLAGCAVGGGGSGPMDTDGDGVADDLDQCVDTPAGATVDSLGCTVEPPVADSDGDGVADSADQCPGTLAGAVVNANGCADSDADGVFDFQDQCAGTAAGAPVDVTGCVVAMTPPDGATLFALCGGCHTGNGVGGGSIGPNLTGVSAATLKAKLGGGHRGFSNSTFTDAELDAISVALTP